jgi:hypothetical protein
MLMKLEFAGQDFEKRSKISNFMKLRQVAAELFHAGGPTDGTYRHDKANVRFSQFCKSTYTL